MIQNQPADTIDLTPKWAEVAPMLILILQDGSPEGQSVARAELQRMAELADAYVAITREVSQ